MGSYFELTIGNCNVFSSKSYVIPEVMSLFSIRDRCYEWKKYKDIYPEESGSEFDEDDYAVCKYQCKARTVKKRLDILGFDLESTIGDFDLNRQAEIQKYEEWSKDEDESIWIETIETLKSSGFKNYIDSYKTIFKESTHAFYYKDKHPGPTGLIKYILEAQYDDSYMGFPCSDIRYFFRAFLEVVPEGSSVILDMTDLVNSGYYRFDDDIINIAYQELTADYPVNAKIIVLCEGSSDKSILERSIKLLYPDYSDHYSFMDFNVSNVKGGAASLVETLKAFMAAGIENRIIALFDNDTAARSARKPLAEIDLPDHIKVISYPSYELLNSYPTIGPGGIQELDVNGLAGSIELYLGEECIKDSGNQLYPVQWKGYMQDLDAYHGEVINKSQIQKKFYRKLEDCELNQDHITAYDWEGLNFIIESLFNCFGKIAANNRLDLKAGKLR